MLPPVKRQELVQEIKRRIRKIVYPPGYRLPVEPEFAKEFGVARETLRGALDILCKEQLIRRIPGKGTFVASSKSKYGTPQKQILVLVPCADYFIRSGYMGLKHLNSQLAGCLASAYRMDCQIVTLPISPNNTQEDIDWDSLDRLNSESLVLISGNWYSPIYPLLEERGCFVVHLHDMNFKGSPWERYVSGFVNLNYTGMKHNADPVRKLLEAGCRRIALCDPWLNDPINRTLPSYLEEIAANNPSQEPLTYCFDPKDAPFYPEKLQEYHSKTHFDGLITFVPEWWCPKDYNASFQANLGLPEDVRILTLEEYEFNRILRPAVPFQFIDYEELGKIAVKILLERDETKKQYVYDYIKTIEGMGK